MNQLLSREGLVVMIGWPLDTLAWFAERFYAAEFDPVYGIITLRHSHPDCLCKGTLRWRLDDFKLGAEEPCRPSSTRRESSTSPNTRKQVVMNDIAQIVLASACAVCMIAIAVSAAWFALREGRTPRG
jgi:hypothetical protein